jgi:4,5-dihydroxyphthalate decarboxylase
MAAKLRLSFVTNRHERVEPLCDGTVPIEGAELITTYSDPSETFWRQLKFQEFDVSEMSISSFLIARERGLDGAYLPVFPSRQFFWTGWSYNTESGIKTASDLTGKRLGVGEYQQTASLWARGVFEHDFGVSQFKVDWYMERSEELSHGGATGFTPPPGISFNRIPEDKSLASMLVNHELDAAPVGRAFSRETNIIDRSTTIRGTGGDWSKVKPLFPDRMAEGIRFYQKWGFVPANHGYIIRGSIYRENPWLAFNLYKALLAAKEVAQERIARSLPSSLILGGEYIAMNKKSFGDDPFAYGIADNRKMLQTAIDFSHEQGFIKEKPKPEELVPEVLRGL